MSPAEIAAAFGLELPPPEGHDLEHACCWCGKRQALTWRTDHWTCEQCWQGGGGEYPDELAMRVSRKMLRAAFSRLPRDRDGRPILPSLTHKAWMKLRH